MQCFNLEAQNIQRYTANFGVVLRGAIRFGWCPVPPWQSSGYAPGFTSSTWNKLSPGLSCNPNPNPNFNPNRIISFLGGKMVHTSHFLVIGCKQSLNGHRHIHIHMRCLHAHTHINTVSHIHSGRAAVACVIMRQSLEGLIWTVLYHLPGNNPQL